MAAVLDSFIAYFAALGLFIVLWTVYGWILDLVRRHTAFETNGRWLIGKRNRNG
ncbi:MAG: hypothetical protein FWH16_04650 [Oscillospiraceae bacterium]|nr:hypothetical protein [Oscillospiraceae bacterium]